MGAKNKRYRAGVIGAGAIAQAFHLPRYHDHERVELVAFSDPDPERHREMGKLYGSVKGYAHYADMLAQENLDIVSVCTPNKFHADATIKALQAGCHVLCEKPMAVSLKEVDQMTEAAKTAKRKLMIGYTHRLMLGPERCKALLKEKAIGKPFMIRVRFAHSGPYPGWAKGDWFYKPELSAGGVMLDMGIHAIDLCLWLFGPIISVSAKANTLIKKIAVDDNALLMLEFKNGAMGYIEVGWTSKPGFSGLEIYGTEGSLICDYLKGLQRVIGKVNPSGKTIPDWKLLEKNPTQGGWAKEIDYWIDVVEGKQKLTMDARAGRDALEVALAAYKSSASGKAIQIGQGG